VEQTRTEAPPDASAGGSAAASTSAAARRYAAFISYSHRDADIAKWLHGALERFSIPADLREQAGRRRLAPVFRDEAELASSADLGRSLIEALAASDALIVIASPTSARSPWVEQEIVTFKQMGRADRVFCLIVDGTPFAADAGEPEKECLSRALKFAVAAGGLTDVKQEPLGVDLRKDGKGNALLRLAAGLLGVGYDALKRREQRRRQRQLTFIAVASAVGMAITSGLAIKAYLASKEAQREARISQETTNFLLSLFQTADPVRTRGESITAREVLDAGLTRIHGAFAADPDIRANLLTNMGEVYQGLGLYSTSADLFEEIRDNALLSYLTPAERLHYFDSYTNTLFGFGDLKRADEIMKLALPELDAQRTTAPLEVAKAKTLLAELALQNDENDKAAGLLEETLRGLAAVKDDARLVRATAFYDLGAAQIAKRDLDGAKKSFRTALDLRQEALDPDHPYVAEVRNALAAVEYESGDYSQAQADWLAVLPLYKRYYGEQHPEYSTVLQNYGLLVLESGDFKTARDAFQTSLTIDEAHTASDHTGLVFSLNSLGLAEMGLGRLDAARAAFDRGLDIARSHKHRILSTLLVNRADLACRAGEPAPVEAWLKEAETSLDEHFDRDQDAWRWAQRDNVSLFCAVRRGQKNWDRTAAEAGLSVIRARWGDERLYTRQARWRLDQISHP